MTFYRSLSFLGEGVFDVGAADVTGTVKPSGMVGFDAGPFTGAPAGTPITSLMEDLAFSNDGEYVYALNAAHATVDVFRVHAGTYLMQGATPATFDSTAAIPGIPLPTDDVAATGDDEEWARQIGYWKAWSGAAGIQGLATYPRP